jgi:hypothetical protein
MSTRSRYFATAKRRVLKNVLAPAGFVFGNSIYVSKIGSQIHGVQFQASRGGEGYFVNLTFHYDFLPGFFRTTIIPHAQMHLLDMLFWARLDKFDPSPDRGDMWYYAEDREVLEQTLAENARTAISVLEEHGERWRDPAIFLELVPPELIEKDLAGGYMDRSGIFPIERSYVLDALGGTWHFDDFGLSYSLAYIAGKLRRLTLARRYLELGRGLAEVDAQKKLINVLSNEYGGK